MTHFAWRALVTAFAMLYTLVSLQACATRQQQEPVVLSVADQPVREPGIVNIFQSREEVSQPLQQAIELYSASNPGAHINVQTVGNMADYRVTLRSKLLSGEQVDIFQYFSGREARELSGYLEDLSGIGWVDSAAADTANAVCFDKKTLGIPYSLEGYGLLANRKVFETLDIPLGGIITFEDLSAVFEELDALIDDGTAGKEFPNLNYVTELPLQDKNFLGSYPADLLMKDAFNLPADAAEIFDISYPQGDAVESFFRLLLHYGPRANLESADGLSWKNQVEDFAEGRIAVLFGDTECYRDIIALNPSMEDRVALLPIPLEGVPNSTVGVGTPLYWGINANSSDVSRESAKRFLTWLYQSESGSVVLASRFKLVSPYLENAKETGFSTHRQMLSYLERGRVSSSVWREFPVNWGSGAFASGIRSWVAGDLAWEEMLDACRVSWAYNG